MSLRGANPACRGSDVAIPRIILAREHLFQFSTGLPRRRYAPPRNDTVFLSQNKKALASNYLRHCERQASFICLDLN